MDPVQQMQSLMIGMISLKKDLDDIKGHLSDKVPWLPIEEAIEGFTLHLQENTKPNTQKGCRHFLSTLRKAYQGRNVATISADELQRFLALNWGNRKTTTLKRAAGLLRWFYAWCIKYCQRHGRPPFIDPCQFIEVKDPPSPERPQFTPIETMGKFLGTARDERQWLAFAILLTAGLRASELVGDPRSNKPGLRKMDVNGRILTIHAPKSGKEEEIAIIPEWVASRLKAYMLDANDEDKVVDISYSTLQGIVTSHSKQSGQRFTTHYLRKWIATFWNNMGEPECADFVLRHHAGLRSRYIALPIDMIKERQDAHLNVDVFAVAPPPLDS